MGSPPICPEHFLRLPINVRFRINWTFIVTPVYVKTFGTTFNSTYFSWGILYYFPYAGGDKIAGLNSWTTKLNTFWRGVGLSKRGLPGLKVSLFEFENFAQNKLYVMRLANKPVSQRLKIFLFVGKLFAFNGRINNELFAHRTQTTYSEKCNRHRAAAHESSKKTNKCLSTCTSIKFGT